MTVMKAAKPKVPASVVDMTDGQLADEHRGHTFARLRTKDKLTAIEAELDRRGLEFAQGEHSFVSRQITDVGLVDLKRLRADLGDDIWREYGIPGSTRFWRSDLKKKDQPT